MPRGLCHWLGSFVLTQTLFHTKRQAIEHCEMASKLEELVEFLHSPQANIREIAIENLVGYSAVGGTHQKIFHHDNYRSVQDLKILVRDTKLNVVESALKILANLAHDEHIRGLVLDDDSFIKYIISKILDLQYADADLVCILLANLSKDDKITKILTFSLDEKACDQSGTSLFKSSNAMDCLLELFAAGSSNSLNKKANFDYLGYLFANLSSYPKGRHYFVNTQADNTIIPISKVLKFTDPSFPEIRRQAVASVIKNSLFDTERHLTLLQDEDIDLLTYILSPLLRPGNKGLSDDEILELPTPLQTSSEDDVKETSKDILAIHLESIVLLCVSREVREYLRTKAVYPVVRELHKVCEEDEFIQELCDRIVQLLMRDEAPTNVEVDAMHSDDESDEDDDKITEIV